jgi:hypothetical protein
MKKALARALLVSFGVGESAAPKTSGTASAPAKTGKGELKRHHPSTRHASGDPAAPAL